MRPIVPWRSQSIDWTSSSSNTPPMQTRARVDVRDEHLFACHPTSPGTGGTEVVVAQQASAAADARAQGHDFPGPHTASSTPRKLSTKKHTAIRTTFSQENNARYSPAQPVHHLQDSTPLLVHTASRCCHISSKNHRTAWAAPPMKTYDRSARCSWCAPLRACAPNEPCPTRRGIRRQSPARLRRKTTKPKTARASPCRSASRPERDGDLVKELLPLEHHHESR